MEGTVTLDHASESIKYLCKKDKRLAKVISMIGPISYQTGSDPYMFLIGTIIGQMLSNKVADILTARLTDLCGGTITPAAINALSDERIKGVGLSASKVTYIRNLTVEVQSGGLDFTSFFDLGDREVIKKLTAIRGIGSWTAKMYLIFILDRQNVLPVEDMAFLQSYGWLYKTDDYKPAVVAAKCKKWSPYASIAARYLYRALDTGLTKETFHLYK